MKNDRNAELAVAYSYVTMAKIAIIDSGMGSVPEINDIIEQLSEAQIKLAPLTVKKIGV